MDLDFGHGFIPRIGEENYKAVDRCVGPTDLCSRDPQERLRWIRQLAELDASSPRFAQMVDELIEYASMNSYCGSCATKAQGTGSAG